MTFDSEPLVRHIWREVEARRDMTAGQHVLMPDIIETERRPNESRFSDAFPVMRHWATALELAKAHRLAGLTEAIAEAAPNLRWSQNASYNDSNCSRAFLDGYAYASLAGPDVALTWAAPRTGVMLMGPDVLYPGHNHAAREIYMLLTPGAEWRLDNGDWFSVNAGDLIFHDSWRMHEMRTGDAPMLAIAAWIDDGDRRSIQWDSDRKGAIR
ncbi:MAG: dimethylsulfonioproprionate lyase family protein [Pseudomonadota bacterium]